VVDEHHEPDLTQKNELKQRAGPASRAANQDPVSGQQLKPMRVARTGGEIQTDDAQAVNESRGPVARR
jgi:hypothetical protein